jgi:hypothetical protein
MFAANFMQLLSTLHRAKGSVSTGGANFAVRASTLAAVGGIDLRSGYYGAGTDDVEVGRKIAAVRRGASGVTRGSYPRPAYTHQAAAGGRRIQRIVGGAIIDTDSDREEELYRKGVPIVNTWNPEHGFDTGKQRDASQSRVQERVGRNTGVIINRIENDMEGAIRLDNDRAVVETALQYVFRRLEQQGRKASDGYRLKYDNSGNVMSFQFTKLGRKCVANQLKRDARGAHTPYGRRRREAFYHDRRAGLIGV